MFMLFFGLINFDRVLSKKKPIAAEDLHERVLKAHQNYIGSDIRQTPKQTLEQFL